MDLSFFRHTLQLKDTFTLASSSRTSTPDLIIELEHEGITGFGEASMPPYLGESYESAEKFLSGIDLSSFDDPEDIGATLSAIDAIAPGNNAAKAALDIAIHDWAGKKKGLPWYSILGLDREHVPQTSFTIGIDTKESVRRKVAQAGQYKILKVKLGRGDDAGMIETIREMTDVPIRVDVNGGWHDRNSALKMIEWLAEKNVELVEQPLPPQSIDDLVWLREHSPIPIVADEAVWRPRDVPKARGVYDGINVKLMKSAGMHEAYRMIMLARELGLKVMLGCMTETTCAISAAAQLSPLADWADLDGAELIANDIFDGAKIIDGKVWIPERPGIGVVRR